jgi:hypothetical protein
MEDIMSEKKSFKDFFTKFGIGTRVVVREEVVLEMEREVDWESALSVGQVWFLFGKNEDYLGLLNDETMDFEERGSS